MPSPSYTWREHLLPGPAATTGYRTVLLVGTTGAGKTTLLRQLIGTDPTTESFPATATFKTTTTETEVLCAPGDHYAVAVFAERAKVETEITECVVAASAALLEGRPLEVARDALAAHTDERLRLEYILGRDWLDEGVALLGAIVGSAAAGLEGTAALDAVAADHRTVALIDRLVALVGQRFPTLRYGQLLWDDDAGSPDSWPRCWRFTCDDRAAFLAALRRLASNERGSYGALLSPMVEAIRVRGPFHPTWAAELPYLMVVDTEGLGHVPTSAAALPVGVLEQLDRAERIVLVDDATHPMQAAPLAALRQLATSGHADKLAICFTHLDEVGGPNVASDDDRRAVLRRSVNQATTSLRTDLTDTEWERLRRQLDEHVFFLSAVDIRLDGSLPAHRTSIVELQRLLGWMRRTSEVIVTADLRPAYRLGELRSRLTAGLERFVTEWRARLGGAHWRQVQALCVRLGDDVAEGYAELQPVAELAAQANEALRAFAARPVRWAGITPSDEQQLALVDAFGRAMGGRTLDTVREVLAERPRPAWRAAGKLSGPDAGKRRLALVDEQVLTTLLAPGADGPLFVTRLVEEVRGVAEDLGFDVGDTIVQTNSAVTSSVLGDPDWMSHAG